MTYRHDLLDSIKSDHRRAVENADWGMIRKALALAFFAACVCWYGSAIL